MKKRMDMPVEMELSNAPKAVFWRHDSLKTIGPWFLTWYMHDNHWRIYQLGNSSVRLPVENWEIA